MIYEFALILWDGPNFFGLKLAKLDRITGKPVGFLTKLLDFEWVVESLVFLTIVLYVFISQLSKHGTLKA